MPDCLTSIFVAMGGRVEMAVCNALGSNMFDILLGLYFSFSFSLFSLSLFALSLSFSLLL